MHEPGTPSLPTPSDHTHIFIQVPTLHDAFFTLSDFDTGEVHLAIRLVVMTVNVPLGARTSGSTSQGPNAHLREQMATFMGQGSRSGSTIMTFMGQGSRSGSTIPPHVLV